MLSVSVCLCPALDIVVLKFIIFRVFFTVCQSALLLQHQKFPIVGLIKFIILYPSEILSLLSLINSF